MYNNFSSGALNDGPVLSEKHLGAAVTVFIGRTKTNVTRVSSQCPVVVAVSAVGQYFEYCAAAISTEKRAVTVGRLDSRASAFSLLTKGAKEGAHTTPNSY